MTFERKELAGVDDDGKPRGSSTASDLLQRVHREIRRLERGRFGRPSYPSPPIGPRSQLESDYIEEVRAYHTAERKAEGHRMQVLGIGLELHTSHRPSLQAAFPWLLKWIVTTLEYVVALENKVIAQEAAIENGRKTRRATKTKHESEVADLQGRLDTAEDRVTRLERELAETVAALAEARGEIRIVGAERNAALAAVGAVLLALRIAAGANPELMTLANQLEDLKQ